MKSTGAINVVCVKWGHKYKAEDVTRLKAMVERNLSLPHEFYCYTEDSRGVDAQVIPIPHHSDLVAWWNKLALFQYGFGGFSGRLLYFDIDIVIQNNIDDIVWYHPEGLTCVKAYWKGEQAINTTNYNMNVNSSVMSWNQNECAHIWEYFINNKKMVLDKYIGIDRFLYHEGFQLKYWPKGWIYSRLNGYDLRQEYYSYKKRIKYEVFSCPPAKICLLNGVWSMPKGDYDSCLPKQGMELYYD